MKTLNDRKKEGRALEQAIEMHQHCYYKRLVRLKKRIASLLEYKHPYFITLTLNETSTGLKMGTYKRKITQTFDDVQAIDFVYNIDYGKSTERLHFHAIVSFNNPLDYKQLYHIWKYGAINIKPIIIKNAEALKKYIAKQTNHAIKRNAGTIFYKRKKKKESENINNGK